MAQWEQMNLRLSFLPPHTLSEIYPDPFPLDVRHYLASWIEEQKWELIDTENIENEPQAKALLDRMVLLMEGIASQNPVLERLKLQNIIRHLNVYQQAPLDLVRTLKDILRKERHILGMASQTYQPIVPSTSNGIPQPAQNDAKPDVDNLVLRVVEIQNCRQKLHQLQEELNWEKQDVEPMAVQIDMDPQNTEKVTRQNRIQQLEFNYNNCAKERIQLLHGAVFLLEQCQTCLIQRVTSWRWEQYRATIGITFDDNLGPLHLWCEQLLVVNNNLRQELMLVKRDHGEDEFVITMQENLARLLQALIQNSLVVEKQPPQVIKTQSKFSTTVRCLLGQKVAPGKPVLLKASIITESQAKNLCQQGTIPNENVGELLNGQTILEHDTNSKNICATFRNMSIKRIKRADRKGSESVTEEKFALLFTTEITITGCESPYSIQVISHPLVVIVHGSQEINALATIIWDCAFSEPNRTPFAVPERVPWKKMGEALSSKFMSEVQTPRGLNKCNLHFLAQKIFDQSDIADDFSNVPVSWAQFNKEVLPGRNFTFWQWFEGVMELTKKCLRDYWTDGLIYGFIGKQHIHVILHNKPNGAFLLRFSDSEIGGITIAYVGPTENGGRKVQNIQPFTKKDLESAGLGDRIRDISCISHVYPDIPKNDAFHKYFTVASPPNPDGYLPFKLRTVVTQDLPSPTPAIPLQNDPMDIYPSPLIMGSCTPNMNQEMFQPLASHCASPFMQDQSMNAPGSLYQTMAPPSDEALVMDALEGMLQM